jgi:glyoxylase-like metal-dependent hydrolase (beta-lactamase superfamily II)
MGGLSRYRWMTMSPGIAKGNMKASLTRRRALAGGCAALLAAGWPRLVGAQAGAPASTQLEPDLVLLSGAGANVVALASPDGLLLVDGGAEAHAAALQGALAQRWPGRPVKIAFNTNWRGEHTGANAALRGGGATVMAHENTKLWLGGDFFVDWEDRHYAPRPAAMLPNKTFYTSGNVELGGRTVEYWHLPRAHTDGDVAVFIPHANVLAASDLLSVGAYPVPDYATGGWIGGLVDATQMLLDATDAKTRVVAAQGGVYGRAELEAQLELCTAVRSKAAEAFRAGMSFADFVASKPTAAFDAKWGDPQQFLRLVYKGGVAHLRELGGVI